MDSIFVARPIRLFGVGLAALFFGCNSAPPPNGDSVPSSAQVDGGVASVAAVDTSSAGAPGTGGMGDPGNGQRPAVTTTSNEPTNVGSGGSVAISMTDPTGGTAPTVVSTTDPSGSAPVCEAGEMRCFEGCTETCTTDGKWGPAVSCPAHQTCGGSPGQAKCVCKFDKDFCQNTVGPVCDSDTSFLTCAKDENGCIFRTPTTKCAHACEGEPGKAVCAEGQCTTPGETRCESSFTLETCSATEDGGNAFVATACGAGTVCGRNTPASCLDPNWADWPMPNGLVDVGNGAPNLQHFTDNGDGSVTDNVTGLEWSWVTFYAQTLADAQDVCAGMHLLDEGDWRVPSLIELISIADFGEPSNIDLTFFPGPHDLQRWTTTLRGDGSDEHFSFNFALGQVAFIDDQTQDPLHPHAITCVR